MAKAQKAAQDRLRDQGEEPAMTVLLVFLVLPAMVTLVATSAGLRQASAARRHLRKRVHR
jgi:ABC-type transport system involved in cytochrome bd biosynthesis fused ATPase/permease subunit